MKVLVIGAGLVGTAVLESLHDSHDVTVVDQSDARLAALSYRYDILTIQGNGASRSTLLAAGVQSADLIVASTDSSEANIVAALIARRLSAGKVVARTDGAEYLEAWRHGEVDVDFMVSTQIETAQAVARAIGLPSAVQTDVFANGRVEFCEFEVHPDRSPQLIGKTIGEADVPDECVVASIIRRDRVMIPGGADTIEAFDRLVFISSPQASREWARRLSGRALEHAREVVVAGGGVTGKAIAALLDSLGMAVRMLELDPERARQAAEELPGVQVFCASATDQAFLEREHFGKADTIVCCTQDDSVDLLIGLLGKKIGIRQAITVVSDHAYVSLFEGVGIDRAIDQRQVTAEEIVRFTHDPRTLAFAMVHDDVGEVIELEVSATSSMLGKPFRDRPLKGAIVGAIIRGDDVVFPRADDVLRAGDHVIVFADSRAIEELERVL